MYNYKEGIEVTHIEALSFKVSKVNPILDWIFCELEEEIPENWFDFFKEEINAQLKLIEDKNLQHELTLLREIAEYAYHSDYTLGLKQVNYIMSDQLLELQFAFTFSEDVELFLIGLWDKLESCNN